MKNLTESEKEWLAQYIVENCEHDNLDTQTFELEHEGRFFNVELCINYSVNSESDPSGVTPPVISYSDIFVNVRGIIFYDGAGNELNQSTCEEDWKLANLIEEILKSKEG